MSLSSTDIRAMQLPAIALVVAIVASATMVWFASNKYQQSQRQDQDQMIALQEAKTRFQRSGEERETVLRYIEAYRELQKTGFIGAEQRLNWVESLRVANMQAALFGVDYQLSAQESFPQAGQINPAGNRVKQSKMRISFGALHEGDLTRLLQTLSTQSAGVFALNSCSLDRAGRKGAPVPRQANLTAECELSWLTIDPGAQKP